LETAFGRRSALFRCAAGDQLLDLRAEPNREEKLHMRNGTLSNIPVLIRGVVVIFALISCSVAARGQDGAETYKTRCSPCHGVDGSGNTPAGRAVKAQDLRAPTIQSKQDAELAKLIADGKGKMPAFKSSLSGDQIKSVVAHIRTLKK
jgi:cytochrome c6